MKVGRLRHGACGLDIGGSLTKLAMFCADGASLHPTLQFGREAASGRAAFEGHPLQLPALGGSAHFAAFTTSRLDECIRLVASACGENTRAGTSGRPALRATGGGSVRLGGVFASAGLDVVPLDELQSMVRGLDCVLALSADGSEEAFLVDAGDPLVPCPPARAAALGRIGLSASKEPWPYVFASLGSGLSIVHVKGPEPTDVERVGGSSIAGGTLWGLGRLLLDAQARRPSASSASREAAVPGSSGAAAGSDGAAGYRYEALLDLAERGDSGRVDLTVGDIYGRGGCAAIGLDAAVPAASLGKISSGAEPDPADLAQSLLWMVSWNAAQLAAVEARRLGVRDVYLGGNMVRGRLFPLATISNSVKFNSAGEARAIFLRREGFLGALGALLE
jgi:type II pantothenate kinase